MMSFATTVFLLANSFKLIDRSNTVVVVESQIANVRLGNDFIKKTWFYPSVSITVKNTFESS